MKEEVGKLQIAAESWKPERVLRWAFDTFGETVAISSAFGAEGMALIEMASQVRQNFRLFTLDTEFARRTGAGSWSSTLAKESRPMLRSAEGSAARAQAGRTAGVDYQHPARSNLGPGERWQNRVGYEIRSGKDQSHR